VHGVERLDSLDADAPIARIASRLTRYGVTAFCPTTVACTPAALTGVLEAVETARRDGPGTAARVLGAHLESNFINPEYKGAQPLVCIKRPYAAGQAAEGDFTGPDVLRVIRERAAQVRIVTMAPEIEGGIDLVRELVGCGIRVSLGHSGASYDEACAGVEAGARHATHLFNRMPPLHHREPGLVGAVLEDERVAAEVVCDGYHVHQAIVRAIVRAKRPERMMAITDGTGASGIPVGSHAELGGRRITARETAAFLDDGTLAGSTLTMDRAFRLLVNRVGVSLVDAAQMCATTQAAALGLEGLGRIEAGAFADLVVLDSRLDVVQTWIAGRCVFDRGISGSADQGISGSADRGSGGSGDQRSGA
ncbi:MAG: N-acetylglucosamine-6-phosphate deacetylase, partial [Vicinamibacteraceae bacterium]|nr:N-acetylglucosamine-6-phosphate deacetylase [Vicinamibacteraceae bacterium]